MFSKSSRPSTDMRPSSITSDAGSALSLSDTNPLLPEDVQNILWSGSVLKRGHFVKSWKTRYATIKGGLFVYYRNELESIYSTASPRGCAAVTSVSRWGSPSDFGLLIETVWLDHIPTKYYVKLFSNDDYAAAVQALQMCAGFYGDIYQMFTPSSAQERAANNHVSLVLGHICGLAGLFDYSIAAVRQKYGREHKFTEVENLMLAAAKFERWRERDEASTGPHSHLLEESLLHLNSLLACTEIGPRVIERLKVQNDEGGRGLVADDYEKHLEEAAFNMAMIHYLQGKFDKAIVEYLLLLDCTDRDFDKADIHVNLSLCYFNKFYKETEARGKAGKAKEEWAEGGEMMEEARAHAFEALNLVPNHPQAMVAIADIQLATGEGGEAVDMYSRTLDCETDNVGCKIRLAKAHLHMNNKKAAIATIKEAVQMDADLAGHAYEVLINILNAVGRNGEAAKLHAQRIAEDAQKAKKRVFAFAANA